MDTELKKYKRDTVKRVIAVLLCLLCLCGMTFQTLSAVKTAEDNGLVYVNFSDAVNYGLLDTNKNEWTYMTFRNGYMLLLGFLETKMTSFGNGTKEDYKRKLKEYNESLDKETDFYKDRVILAASKYFEQFASLYNMGIIKITGMYTTGESEGTNNYQDGYSGFDDLYYRNLDGVVTEPVLPRSVSEKFKSIRYDNVFHNDSTQFVYDEDNINLIATYYPGYYAFTVDDEALKNTLLSTNAVQSFYSSYEEFYEQYLESEKRIKEHAGTAKYFIRDTEGRYITNIEDFDGKTDKKKITDYFGKLGTYSYNQNEAIYLSDGLYYSDTYLDWFGRQGYAYQNEGYTQLATTTTLPSVSEPTTFVGISSEYGENATVIVPTKGTIYIDENGEAVTIPETTRVSAIDRGSSGASGNIELYIGFDKNAEYETCHFASLQNNIDIATVILKSCLLICGTLGLLLLICIFYLIAITGKRKGRKEIQLYRTDRVFPEIRIALTVGVGFLCFLGICYFGEMYLESMMKKITGTCILALVILFFLVCLDLLLYLARHIKNHSLVKNIFIVWCIRRLIKYGSRIKAFINERLLYTKELKKTVIIRTAAVVAINIIAGFIALVFIDAKTWEIGLPIIFALFLFDLWILYRGIRFTGGVDKLFAVVKEMHEGNTDIEINKNALPEYLYLPAENLQSLNEGIKAAVEEAVKQEKTKTELITNVSHDLKTPLTSIINYVDLLKKCDITDETALSYLQVLSEKSDRLKVLIEDLVEASKASAGALSVDFVCVSCRELINQLIGEFEESFEVKGLSVVVSVPESDVRVRADSRHIYRVLENLFVNVRKYALENTRVYITVSEKGDRGIINIKNISAAPLNISADELKERFVRGEQSRTTEGNGLGLSIAENLCTLQNGALGIEINGDLFSITVEMEKFR